MQRPRRQKRNRLNQRFQALLRRALRAFESTVPFSTRHVNNTPSSRRQGKLMTLEHWAYIARYMAPTAAVFDSDLARRIWASNVIRLDSRFRDQIDRLIAGSSRAVSAEDA